MTEYEITCSGCNYKAIIKDGPTKSQALKKLPYRRAFFCPDVNQKAGAKPPKPDFIGLQVSHDTEMSKDESEFAVRTQLPVEQGSKQFFFQHKDCAGKLTPLEFYQQQKDPECPICRSGKLSFKVLRRID